MNITINGYLKYSCGNCNSPYTIESQDTRFSEDVSPESEDEEFVRYFTQIDAPCESCGNRSLMTVEVWENPTAVINYSYYAVQNAKDIECEFSIEHYFDDESSHTDDGQSDSEPPEKTDGESDQDSDLDDEIKYNESSEVDEDVYQDHYDEDPDF